MRRLKLLPYRFSGSVRGLKNLLNRYRSSVRSLKMLLNRFSDSVRGLTDLLNRFSKLIINIFKKLKPLHSHKNLLFPLFFPSFASF